MAVTFSIVRGSHFELSRGTQEFCTATLSGTYTTGGFTFNPLQIMSGPGTSPLSGTRVLDIAFRSPSGYMYASSTSGSSPNLLTTVQIFSAPGVELANNAAVPDTTLSMIIVKTRT